MYTFIYVYTFSKKEIRKEGMKERGKEGKKEKQARLQEGRKLVGQEGITVAR